MEPPHQVDPILDETGAKVARETGQISVDEAQSSVIRSEKVSNGSFLFDRSASSRRHRSIESSHSSSDEKSVEKAAENSASRPEKMRRRRHSCSTQKRKSSVAERRKLPQKPPENFQFSSTDGQDSPGVSEDLNRLAISINIVIFVIFLYVTQNGFLSVRSFCFNIVYYLFCYCILFILLLY